MGSWKHTITNANNYLFGSGNYGYINMETIFSNANNGNFADNPMSTHADSLDIHPYNIKMLPLIAY